MRAVTCTEGKLEVVDLPEPTPGRGQLLINVLRCGICGSDLHARHHCDELADLTAETGYDGIFRSNQPAVLGHEFCGEVVAGGPRAGKSLPPGTRVVSFPLLRNAGAVHATGLSASAPGGYAEQMLVDPSAAPMPKWIWGPETAKDEEERIFRVTFDATRAAMAGAFWAVSWSAMRQTMAR